MDSNLISVYFQALHQPRKKFKWTLKEQDEFSRLSNARKQIVKMEQMQKLQKHEINILKEKNASLMLRNAEFTKLKIIEQLGERRSTLLVDASLFSNAFHAGDYLMQEQQSVLLDASDFQSLKKITLDSGAFSKVEKVTFQVGKLSSLQRAILRM